MTSLRAAGVMRMAALLFVVGCLALSAMWFGAGSAAAGSAAAGSAAGGLSRASGSSAGDPGRQPVIVELFTSEGCSSCPPADAVLARLQGDTVSGARVIALGMHVDYWNSLGWRDPYSSAIFTDRQGSYAAVKGTTEVYTPEMIVDGDAAFVGSDEGRARDEIAKAAQGRKTPLAIKAAYDKAGAVRVSLKLGAALPAGARSPVMLVAVTQDGLTSNIRAGENEGLKLTHAAVVRELQDLGTAGAQGAETTATLKTGAGDGDASAMHIAAFVQDSATGKILAAADTEWPEKR